ncbi:MAG: hypothetical protein NC489_08725 [Ruminococcus flavefaciens]|nr:hypothetical protein [Ruminococcus flavefaciens]
MLNQADGNYEIVAKFAKNEYTYVLIGYDPDRKIYHAWKRIEAEEHSEGFSTRYDNKYIDSLEIGDHIDLGDYVQKSTNFDKHMNYQYGKNINVLYLVSPYVYEDGILAMNGVDEMFNTFRSHTKRIKLGDNEVLVNLYGGSGEYQGLPKVGEKTKNGIVCAVRRTDSASAPRALKSDKLRAIERSDRPCYGSGRVVDIEILTNRDPDKMPDTGANKMVKELYMQQQEYYRELFHYMNDIAERADDEGYTYSDGFGIIAAEARDFIDASAFFADSSDTVYGTTEIVVHLLDEEKMIVGSKFVGRSGNKGVIAKILPKEKSWTMEDGTPVHFVVAALGIVGRLNQSQLNEHSCNELGANAVRMMKQTDDVDEKLKIATKLLKHLNPDEAQDFKKWWKNLDSKERAKFAKRIERRGITIVQDPIDNADILDIARAYKDFPPNYQRIVFPDGGKSMRKVLCAKMFYVRLKQDPLEKYSTRSRGPVNPLTTLPAKSNLKKKSVIPYSDVPVRFGEMEIEILQAMVPHPFAIADFMMENSTSFDAKFAMSRDAYLAHLYDEALTASEDGDTEEDVQDMVNEMLQADYDMGTDELIAKGKKNIEQIAAYLNVLGTRINIDYEVAPEGEYFQG